MRSCVLSKSRLAVLALGATLVVLSGWSSSSSSGRPIRHAETRVISTGAGAEVTEGYLAYRQATRDAVRDYGRHITPFDPADFQLRFSPVATGAQYDEVFNSSRLNRLEGFVDYRATDRSRLHLAYLDADRAVIEDCADGWLIRAVLRLESGSWNVSLENWGAPSVCR